MNNWTLILLFLFFSLSASSQSRKLILIGVDGLGSWGLVKADTPVMDSLIQNGAYTLKAKSLYPTLSSPNWASMITGVKPKQHLIKTNQWEPDTGRSDNYKFPTLFRLMNIHYPSDLPAAFVQWERFIRLTEPGIRMIKVTHAHEDSVISKAGYYLNQVRPTFLFIHLDLVDKAGHMHGLKSIEYRRAVEKADHLIGDLFCSFAEIQDYVVIITSDHGFSGKHHGGFSRKTKNIPWLVSGMGIKSGYKIRSKVKVHDTAPTIGTILAIKLPGTCTGKVVEEIFIPAE